MLFNSYQFIFLFLPLTILLFFLLNKMINSRAAASWLAFASICFYGFGNSEYIPLLLFSIVFNYVVGMLILQTGRKNEQKSVSKWLLFLGIGINLLLLGYHKYTFFISQNINDILNINLDVAKIPLPIGISFFTFTQISFLVDAYYKKAKEYNAIHYGLFVTFFPHLVAGPILHHKEMIPQFTNPKMYRFNYQNLAVGLSIFFIGLFKKVCFADLMVARYVHSIFDGALQGHSFGFFECWGGALAYTLQLYFDFSGYSDMAIGLAQMIGIKIPLNFYSPYKATNIIEFWQRWHMSLSRFLRDYLYIPLGGNRKGVVRRYLNLMVTMLLCGLWHGAGWTFIVWGGLHGLYLVINQIWRQFRKSSEFLKTRNGLHTKIISHLLTFFCVVIGWVIFRAEDMKSAILILKGMAGLNGFLMIQGWEIWISILFLMVIVWFCPNTQQIMERFEPALNILNIDLTRPQWLRFYWQPNWIWGVVISFISAISLAIVIFSNIKEFLYFQF